MSGKLNKRSFWQVLGLYAAISWICLQVVDVLSQNIELPKWVFTGTLGLLLAGLPVAAAAAYFHGSARRAGSGIAPAEGIGLWRFLQWRKLWKAGIGVLAVWGIAVTGWMALATQEQVNSEWDLVTGIDEIRRLVGEYRYPDAYRLALELDGLIENDEIRETMWAQVSRRMLLQTDPSGARVLRRDYESTEDQWEELGTTPLEAERFPMGLSRVRFELQGYLPRETADFSGRLAAAPPFHSGHF